MHELQVNDSNFLVLSITTRPKKKKKKMFLSNEGFTRNSVCKCIVFK